MVSSHRRTSCAERLCCWGTMGDHMGPPPGVLGHHSLADALVDDRDHHNHTGSEDDVVVFGDRMKRDGYRKGRIYKKGNWTAAEILVLQAARREDFDRVRRGNLKERHKSAQERWKWIEDYGWSQGVHKSAQQCQDKWELLVSEFKKVNDYEKNVPGGQKSYWDMSKEERKKTAMPPNFYKEVYNALAEWYSKGRPADPGELDTSGPLRHTGASHRSHSLQAASDAEFSVPEDSDGDGDPESLLRKRKRKSSLFPLSEEYGLACILKVNNKRVIDAMMESEDRKDKRHREDMDMEEKKLEFEREKFRGTMQLGAGYIGALNSIGDGLKQLGAALAASSQA
ncbi:hypothetical protein M758_7G186700 [Ceratodon purpureus]|nr:hypothetical protein M758_7G186700 [Ceratodon purpureus]